MSIIKSIGRRIPNLGSIRSRVEEIAPEKTINDLQSQAQERISKTFFNPVPRSVRKKLNQARNDGQEILEMEQLCSQEQRIYLANAIEIVHTLLTNLTRLEQDLERVYSGRGNIGGDIKRVTNEIKKETKKLKKSRGIEAGYIKDLIRSKERHLSMLKSVQTYQNNSTLTIDQVVTNLKSLKIEITLITTGEALDDKRIYRLGEELQAASDNLTDLVGEIKKEAIENDG